MTEKCLKQVYLKWGLSGVLFLDHHVGSFKYCRHNVRFVPWRRKIEIKSVIPNICLFRLINQIKANSHMPFTHVAVRTALHWVLEDVKVIASKIQRNAVDSCFKSMWQCNFKWQQINCLQMNEIRSKHLQHDPAGDNVWSVERVSRDLQSSLVTPSPDFRQLTLWRHFNNVESEVNSSSVLVESVFVFKNMFSSLFLNCSPWSSPKLHHLVDWGHVKCIR